MDRRQYLSTTSLLAMATLAGCPDSGSDGSERSNDTAAEPTTPGTTPEADGDDDASTTEELVAARAVVDELSLPYEPVSTNVTAVTADNRQELRGDVTDAMRLLFVPNGDGAEGAVPVRFGDWLGVEPPEGYESMDAVVDDAVTTGRELYRIDWLARGDVDKNSEASQDEQGNDGDSDDRSDQTDEREVVFSSYSILDGQGRLLFDTVMSNPVLTTEWLRWLGRANFGLRTHATLAYRSLRLLERADESSDPSDQYTEIHGWDTVQDTVAGDFDRYSDDDDQYPGEPRLPKVDGPVYQRGAVVREDEFTVGVRESSFDSARKKWGNYFRHFYDPDADHGLYNSSYFEFFKEVESNIALEPEFDEQYNDALHWGFNSHFDGFTWKNAIRAYDYSERSKRIGWETFGHLLHLLQDMNEPDHTTPAGEGVVSLRSKRFPGQSHPAASKFLDPSRIGTWFGTSSLRGYEGYVDSVIAPVAPGLDNIGLDGTPTKKSTLKAFFDAAARDSQGDWAPPGGDEAMGLRTMTEDDIDRIEEIELGEILGRLLDVVRTVNGLREQSIPVVPTIDITNPSDEYRTRARRHITQSQQYGAGFLQYCYELVNPPPFVKSVRIETNQQGKITRQWMNRWRTHDTSQWDTYQSTSGETKKMPEQAAQTGRLTSGKWELARREICTAGDYTDEHTIGTATRGVTLTVEILFGPTASTNLTACSETDPGKKGPYPKRIDPDSVTVELDGPESASFSDVTFTQAVKTESPSPAKWEGTTSLSTAGEYTVTVDATDDEPHHPQSFGAQLDRSPSSPARVQPADQPSPAGAERRLTVQNYDPAGTSDTHTFKLE